MRIIYYFKKLQRKEPWLKLRFRQAKLQWARKFLKAKNKHKIKKLKHLPPNKSHRLNLRKRKKRRPWSVPIYMRILLISRWKVQVTKQIMTLLKTLTNSLMDLVIGSQHWANTSRIEHSRICSSSYKLSTRHRPSTL